MSSTDQHDNAAAPPPSSVYRSNITPRSTTVQQKRLSSGLLPSTLMMTRVSHSVAASSSSGYYQQPCGGAFSTLSSLAAGVPLRPRAGNIVVAINETREREKRELCHLNDKFAQYVEKVRFLEAQNKKLQLELEALQNKAGQGSSRIKEMYEIEMVEARKLIDDTSKDRAASEAKAREAEAEAARLKKRYGDSLAARTTDRRQLDSIEAEIAENEAKIGLLRRRLADIEDEGRRYKLEAQRLFSEIGRLNNELQNEAFAKSSLETEKMALEDELNMLRQMHEAELGDLRSRTVVDVGLDPSQFFRNELANAIREIRAEYEQATDQQRNELHSRYMMHYNELVMRHQKPDLDPLQFEQQRVQEQKLQANLKCSRSEAAHMKARNEELAERIREIQNLLEAESNEGSRAIASRDQELEDLRARLEDLLKEYDDVSSTKTSLEKEISQYRELLEGTINRDGLRQVVEHIEDEARKLESERMAGTLMQQATSAACSSATTTTTSTAYGSMYMSSPSASSARYITSPIGLGVGSAGTLTSTPTKSTSSSYSKTYAATTRDM